MSYALKVRIRSYKVINAYVMIVLKLIMDLASAPKDFTRKIIIVNNVAFFVALAVYLQEIVTSLV